MKTLAFTGHRPAQLGGYDENNPTAILIKENLYNLITQSYKSGYRKFIIGMAMGVDQWAGQIVLELKKEYKDIQLIAAVPFASQSSIWFAANQQTWKQILSQCDEIYIIDLNPNTPMDLETVLELSCVKNTDAKYLISLKLQKRNEWMVDRADGVLAVWKKTSGGTGNCVKYAQSKNKKIICYNPDDNTVSKL